MKMNFFRYWLGCLALAGTLSAAELSWQRDGSDTTALPTVAVANDGSEAISGTLECRLTDADGKVVWEQAVPYSAAPGATAEVKALAELPKLSETVLCEVADPAGTLAPAELQGIFGPARLLRHDRDRLFGMNVHLGRYTPSERWKLLKMLKDAGVTTIRVDAGFADWRDKAAAERAKEALSEELLALEAFGMEPLVLLGFYPNSFYDSPEKSKMAYEWSRWIASQFPGRVSWHYGNETNSGWAGFGAASDMGELHRAFALGTAAADPTALRGSFGIAEGLPSYAKAFLATGAGDELEALCVHPYSGTPEAGIAKAAADKALLRPDQQLWATEIGYHVDDATGAVNPLTAQLTRVMGFSTEQQTAFVSRLYVLAKAFGIDRIYWYDFFGKNDPETFWIVDENLQPKPAYHALANVSKWLDGATSLGGTALDEAVQRHYFRRPDRRVFLVAWSAGKPAELVGGYLKGAAVTGETGDSLGICDGRLALDAAPKFVLLPENSGFEHFEAKQVLASALDERSFNAPAHRFTVKPGERFQVPLTVFNASNSPVVATPEVRKSLAGWRIEAPEKLTVAPGETGRESFTVTVPADAVPGVETHFAFGAGLADGGRTEAYPVRVKVAGDFPYRAIAEAAPARDYPMWDAMNEPVMAGGREEIDATAQPVTVDGKLTEWTPAEFVELDQKLAHALRNPKLPMREDFTVKVAFRYDAERLYAAFLVEDDDLSLLDSVSRDWRDNDNLRIFLSAEPDEAKRGDTLSEKDLLLILSPTGLEHTGAPQAFAAVLDGYAHQGVEAELGLAAQLWQGGYALEASIPWSAIGVDAKPGTVVGLNVLADDADGGFRRSSAMTRLKNPAYWISPKSLGKLILR